MSLYIFLLSTNTIIWIVLGSLAGVLLIALGIWLFEKFFLARRRCEKQILDLEKDYEYYHSLLTGQDNQYINRIELISRTNLLYADIHSNYFRRFKEIRDTLDNQYLECVNSLRDLLNDNEIKEFKKYYANYAQVFLTYKENIDSLNNDLINLIKPEEDARQKVLTLKEKFREVKSKYNTYEQELSYLADSFNKVFDAVDARFTVYDTLVDSAKYDESNEILPELDKVLDTLTTTIIKMPDVIHEINDVLPALIKDITSRYEDLIKQGFPLQTFNIEERITTLKYDLEKIREKIRNLRISHIDEDIEIVHKGISDIEEAFENEKKDREIFETSNQQINSLFQYLENEFIRISNNLPRIKKYYIIDADHANEIEDIRKKINDVSKDKRRLEIYIHQMGQTPYKVLVEKMQDLDKGTQDLKIKIIALTNYIASLKNDTDSAFKLIGGQFKKLKTYEAFVRNEFTDENRLKYEPKFETAYTLIDKIHEILNTQPIDVLALNDTSNKLTNLSSSIFTEVDELNHYNQQTVNSILIGNRERQKFSDVNTLLEQAEKFYISGEFRKASELSSQALNTLKAKDGINK